MLVLTLTPREAVAVADELLAPGQFPWQGSETELIALDVRSSLQGAVKKYSAGILATASKSIPPPEAAQRIKNEQYATAMTCPECGQVGFDLIEENLAQCPNCGSRVMMVTV